MKILIITDTHLGMRESLQVRDYQNSFFEKQFFPYIQENKQNIDLIIHMGDLFDQRKYISYQMWKFWRENFICKLNSFGIPVHLIVGNHDCSSKSTNEFNAPELLTSEFGNFKIFKEPEDNVNAPKGLLYIPWINPNNLENTVATIEGSSDKYVFGHLELNGFTLVKGIESKHSLINTNIFLNFARVFTGHFHIRQNQRNIHYLGCPFELSWNDHGDNKGFHLFDTEKNQLDFIENPLKQYIHASYDDSIEVKIQDIDFQRYTNMFVRLKVKHRSKPVLYNQFLDELYKANPCQLKITEAETTYKENEDVMLSDIKDVFTIIKTNIENREIESEIKPQLIDYMHSIFGRIDASI